MALPRKTRGEYRPIYEALFDGPDYRRLSPAAKLALLTIKGKSGAMGLRVWPALAESLADMTGEKVPAMKRAVKQLVVESWIEYEDGIVWLIRGMEFEPQVSAGKKHRIWLREQRKSLPRVPIVDRFCERYAEFFADVRPDSDTPSDTDAHTLSDTPSYGPADTTSPSPSPSPSPSNTSRRPREDTIVNPADKAHRIALANAANTGITAMFGEQIDVVRWDRRSTHEAAESMAAAQVPIAFAQRTVLAIASSTRPSDGEPPTSLKYFTAAVVKAWSADVARRGRQDYQPPAESDEAPPGSGRSWHPDEWAVKWAQEGREEFQRECDARGIEWRVAS